jgi:type II secretory pathway component GspD/PulD (secretin)
LRAVAASTVLATLGLAVVHPTPARAQELQVIELRHRLANDVIPIVQPLVEPGGVLTGSDKFLFVRTSAANFEQVRQAVDALDRAPRQLLITVGQGTVRDLGTAAVRGSATIGEGDVQVGVNRPPASESGAQVGAHWRTQDANLSHLSSVRALEGSETFIAIGQSVPIESTQVWHGSNRPVVERTVEHRDVTSGFYATARVSGDRVTLEISPHQQWLASEDRGVVQTAASTSTVSARLGEWFELGAVRETSSGSAGGLLTWGLGSGGGAYSTWVKVDEIR